MKDKSTYRAIQPSDFKDEKAVLPKFFWGVMAGSVVIQFVLPRYFLDLGELATELRNLPAIGHRISDHLIIDANSVEFYFVSMILTPVFSLFFYFHMRRRYTPWFPKSDNEQRVALKVFLVALAASLTCFFVLSLAPIISESGRVYRYSWILFPPFIPILSTLMVPVFAGTLLYRIPLKKNGEQE